MSPNFRIESTIIISRVGFCKVQVIDLSVEIDVIDGLAGSRNRLYLTGCIRISIFVIS